MSDKADQLRQARELFAKLGLPGWKELNQQLRPGGQAGVLIVEDESGRRGVFRCLTQVKGNAVERFYREVAILTNPEFRHPSVVEIFAHTTDKAHQWYISKLGHSFEGRWKRFKQHHAGDSAAILDAAVRVLASVADGLARLHDGGVVHRDIKPANIVVAAPDGPIEPILIDFGISYLEAAERLTEADMAVGNKRYSPDVMMNRLDRVPPWLDVFQLAQVLIWMVQVPNASPHWDRPLDWRYVNYDDRLSNDSVLSIRAVTALCSEERISPRNGRELASLLRERFPMSYSTMSETPEVDLAKIRQGIAKGKSAQDIALAEDARMIEVSATAVAGVYYSLRDGLSALATSLQRQEVSVRTSIDVSFEEFARSLAAKPSGNTDVTLYQLDFGEAGSQFHFRVHCVAFVPSLRQHRSGPQVPDSSNCICLYLRGTPILRESSFRTRRWSSHLSVTERLPSGLSK